MDSKSAAAYLIDPLNGPEPSQETGPGASLGTVTYAQPSSSASPTASSPMSSNNPYRKSSVSKQDFATSSHSRQSSRDHTHSPTSKFPNYREEALGGLNDGPAPRRSQEQTRPPNYETATTGRRRGSSLAERFPGDHSHEPLSILRRESKKASRSPHLSKRHMQGPDMIDRLDPTLNKVPYHHEGPYDAASLARNRPGDKMAPVAALSSTNEEALKATPRENIRDAIEKHRPLDGTAVVPPGERDSLGRTYNYEEGTDMMRTEDAPGGPYKRWPGEDYHPDDLAGQSEPSFSLDRALRAHTIHERDFDGHRGIELSDRPMMSDYDKMRDHKQLDTRDPIAIAGDDAKYVDMQHSMGSADTDAFVKRTGSLRRAGEGLKKRIGSLRKKDRDDE
ncbi:hypothetical protein H2203_004681 [Taxawa tesnikishii (nom. ined.)]|nr:hypothetical protein H2203_004681 [Dothideales sp. JES 119]